MYDPRRVLQKYQNKLSELLGVDVTKVKTLAQATEPQPVELTMVEKMMQDKQQRRLASMNVKNKGPDVEAMLREVKQKARSLRQAKRKERPPKESDCRQSVVQDSLNCKKYIAQRMEKAGQNSEYDSSFYFSMYRRAQPQPLRQMIRKVQMIKAADEASQDTKNKTVFVAEQKKSLFEGQIDLVSQYLTQHKKEQLAKDKDLEIKLAQAMIDQVKKELKQQSHTKKREICIEQVKKIESKRPQTSCSYKRRRQEEYRQREQERFESIPSTKRAYTARQSMQDFTINTFHLQETPMLTEANRLAVTRPHTSLKRQNRLRYSTLIDEVDKFGQSRERKAVHRFERKNDKFYDKQLESVRKSSQELEDVFSVIQMAQEEQSRHQKIGSGNNLLSVAKSLQSYFRRKVDPENPSPRLQQKLQTYTLSSNNIRFKPTNIKIKRKLQDSPE